MQPATASATTLPSSSEPSWTWASSSPGRTRSAMAQVSRSRSASPCPDLEGCRAERPTALRLGLCDDRAVNAIDALTLLLIVVALILGWRSGAIPQITGLLGAIVGGVVAILALPYLAGILPDLDPPVPPFVLLLRLLSAVAPRASLRAGIGRAAAGPRRTRPP